MKILFKNLPTKDAKLGCIKLIRYATGMTLRDSKELLEKNDTFYIETSYTSHNLREYAKTECGNLGGFDIKMDEISDVYRRHDSGKSALRTEYPIIHEYIRKRKNGHTHKVGVILGTLVNIGGDAVIKIGWSKCNIKEDTFNSERGIELAKGRVYNETPTITPTPDSIRKQVRQFGARCVRYFKNVNRLELPV